MINADKPHLWKTDIAASVDLYNKWFLEAAPRAYRETRAATAGKVLHAFRATDNLAAITPEVLAAKPAVLQTLRMSTAPPMARDRLSGLAHTPRALVKTLEETGVPPRMKRADLMHHLGSMCQVIGDLLDLDLCPWLTTGTEAQERDLAMATTVVADRLCGAIANPIIRNAQEKRQLAAVGDWLRGRGYREQSHPADQQLADMEPGTFSFRMNVVVTGDGDNQINMPIDAVIQPHNPAPDQFPLLVEAKSAGDFTNTNKRRKEEATKVRQLRATYGDEIGLLLFLCGYFDSGYLGYEAAEGLDWVWEHRIDDLGQAGV